MKVCLIVLFFALCAGIVAANEEPNFSVAPSFGGFVINSGNEFQGYGPLVSINSTIPVSEKFLISGSLGCAFDFTNDYIQYTPLYSIGIGLKITEKIEIGIEAPALPSFFLTYNARHRFALGVWAFPFYKTYYSMISLSYGYQINFYDH